MPAHSIIVAAPNRALRNRLTCILNNRQEFKVVAYTENLMDTYAAVEEHLPTAVLIAESLTALPEFEVMHTLFSTFNIHWLLIKTSLLTDRLTTPKVVSGEHGDNLLNIEAHTAQDTTLQQLKRLTRAETVRATMKKGEGMLRVCHTRTTRARHDSTQHHSVKQLSHSTTLINSASLNSPLILIGASTGGVDALLSVLSNFPPDCPPTLIVQHTGPGFGSSLVGLLDRQCRARVNLAQDVGQLESGTITVGAGTRRHLEILDCRTGAFGLGADRPVSGHVPSIDVLFHSALPIAKRVYAAVLTGMGRDGADGLKALRDAGAFTLAQDKASSVVYGMPRAAVENGGAAQILALQEIGPALLQAAASSVQISREVIK